MLQTKNQVLKMEEVQSTKITPNLKPAVLLGRQK